MLMIKMMIKDEYVCLRTTKCDEGFSRFSKDYWGLVT